ncbi:MULTISPECIES: aspartate aminotransferase family protein [Bacillaceae]|uniref:aspartate aminotransferase family protein n=1 Tax=Bacillaceae TaxID=186817 RepID=UPI000BEC7A34|nr:MULTISPECIES: aspartate aminotransferase family protein [unclassified Bacillus (in: firmicutes)]PEC51839.1 aspartate aminotransferase family protein [Bacillus sp. AFS096315]PFM79079.1 aspartate aminotransferase family protein [Bacillus sp. AFS077874]
MERDYLIKPLLGQHYPMISHGKGVYLFDKDGKRYIDGSSGAITVGIGHGVEEIIDVMTEQAKQVSFVYRSQFTSEPAEKLAKKLSDITQGDLNWTFFVNSGTEATETAMKLAIQHYQEKGMKGKNKILSRWMSYHGITIGALSMSGHPLRRQRFVPILEDYPSVSPPYCYRCPFNLEHPSCDLACASELETAIDRIGPEHIAAFIAEPIIGAAGGAIVPSKGYYQRIKAICEKYDILLIADEVMTGLGRTGKMFAMEHWGVQPDIVTLGKGLTSGYTPMAATIASDRVIEPIMQGSKLVMSGHTFSANPLSAAVSLAVIEYVEKHNLVQAAEEKGNYLLNRLQGLKEKFPFIGDVRGKGLLIGIEFIHDIKSSSFIQKVMSKGLLLYPSVAGKNGKEDSAFMIAPPLTITYGELDELLQILTDGLKELEMEQSQLTYTAKGETV